MRIWADAPILNEITATARDLVLVLVAQSGSAEASAPSARETARLRDRRGATVAILIAEIIEDSRLAQC
jgi:hypothetical protein